jgi:Phospholipase_D-nuclease N-terminal
LKTYLTVVEREIVGVISKNPICYWFHLSRRIFPRLATEDIRPTTVGLVRGTLEAVDLDGFLAIAAMFLLFLTLIAIGGTNLWAWTIIDCATKEPTEGNERVVWILVILLTHFIGALIYLLVRRPKRIQEVRLRTRSYVFKGDVQKTIV